MATQRFLNTLKATVALGQEANLEAVLGDVRTLLQARWQQAQANADRIKDILATLSPEVASVAAVVSAPDTPTPGRLPMTPDARKRISRRMKHYWAKRRAGGA